MQYFDSVKNKLLIGDENTLRMKTIVNPDVLFTAPQLYGRSGKIQMPKDIDMLSMSFLKFDLTKDASALFNTNNFGFKVLSDIKFKTRSGLVMTCLKPEYQMYKLDRIAGTSLYDKIIKGMTLLVAFTAGTATSCSITIPLFLFYSTSIESYLSIRNIEDIEIALTVNNAYDMGMLTTTPTLLELTSLNVSLIQESYNSHPSYLDQFEHTKGPFMEKPPKSIKNSYDIYYEDKTPLLAGATSASFLLTNPNPSVNIIASIFKQNVRTQITGYKLKVRNSYIVGTESTPISTDTNYNLANPNVSYIENIHLEHYFNKKHDVISNTGLLGFAVEDNMAPTILEVFFDPLVADSTLHIFYEYPTDLVVNGYRKIAQIDTSSLGMK